MPTLSTRLILTALVVVALWLCGNSAHAAEFDLVVRNGRVMNPAKRLEDAVPQMKRKGRIEIGADADLVVFDPQRIADRATFAEPALPSEGIEHVLVNGVFVVRDGQAQRGSHPGQAVRRDPNLTSK